MNEAPQGYIKEKSTANMVHANFNINNCVEHQY